MKQPISDTDQKLQRTKNDKDPAIFPSYAVNCFLRMTLLGQTDSLAFFCPFCSSSLPCFSLVAKLQSRPLHKTQDITPSATAQNPGHHIIRHCTKPRTSHHPPLHKTQDITPSATAQNPGHHRVDSWAVVRGVERRSAQHS